MEAQCMVISIHEITLSHWEHFCGFAGEKPAISSHFIGLRVNLHTGGSTIQYHGMLADFARVRDGENFFRQSKHLTLFQCGLANECNRVFRLQSSRHKRKCLELSRD